jgi:hypothetical protein
MWKCTDHLRRNDEWKCIRHSQPGPLSSAKMAIRAPSVEFQTNVCYSPDEDEGHIAS